MIGKVTWVGHITCNSCPAQVTDIHWGEARKTLRLLRWQHILVSKEGRRWLCPDCSSEHNHGERQ